MSKGASETLEAAAKGSELQTRMLVTVYGPDQTFYFVANDNADLVFEGNTYLAADIERGEIKASLEGDKEQVSLKMSNKWLEWAAYLAQNITKLNGCVCTISEVFLDHLDEGIAWEYRGVLNKIRMTISEFSCVVERDTVDFSQQAPTMDYGPTCQFVYGDARCRATNPNGPCDQTLNSCDALGNVTRFGGHPSVPREMVIRS